MTYPAATEDTQPAAPLNGCRKSQPARRPGSIRRTVSLQSAWPDGPGAPVVITGRARDLYSDADGNGHILGGDSISVGLNPDGRIVFVEGSRQQEALKSLAGSRPGGEMRKAVAARLPEEALAETCLNRLLDDLAGAFFMSTAAWYAWPDGLSGYIARTGAMDLLMRPVTGLCMSYAPGSPVVRPDGTANEDIAHHPLTPNPVHRFQPGDFHDLLDAGGPNEWRLRRTDAWVEDKLLCIDAWFQDSSSLPDREDLRIVFHEYSLTAIFDPAMFELVTIDVTPHVLPFTTCRASPPTARLIEGLSARDFRSAVPRLLRGTAGCTHLNDMLRSLQDVTALERSLRTYAG
jgi:hypothetical protein